MQRALTGLVSLVLGLVIVGGGAWALHATGLAGDVLAAVATRAPHVVVEPGVTVFDTAPAPAPDAEQPTDDDAHDDVPTPAASDASDDTGVDDNGAESPPDAGDQPASHDTMTPPRRDAFNGRADDAGDDRADNDTGDADDDGAGNDTGDTGDDEESPTDLATVQERLRELGYLVGPADGIKGQQTRAAVMAFQRVNGLEVDGIVGPRTRAALDDPRAPELRGGPATRIEIDLTRQLLHLVEDGERTATLHVSSGDGQPYTTRSGGTAYSNTPVGEFAVERRIAGVREADLGTLYDPLYFYRGWAIHGSNSVPATPDSHGCIRVTRADARWLFDRVADGTPVHLYGGQHVFTPGG